MRKTFPTHQSSGSLVSHRGAVRVKEVVDAANESRSLIGIRQTNFVNQLYNYKLQNVTKVLDLKEKKVC